MVGIFGGAGFFLDATFDKKPVFLFMGVILSFPLNAYLLTRFVRYDVEKYLDKKTKDKEQEHSAVTDGSDGNEEYGTRN